MLYIDMDGVLADFDRSIIQHLGGSCEEVGDERIQAEVPRIKDFWINIPPIPDMRELWEFVAPFNPFILTARASWDHDACVEAKPKWIANHLPDFPQDRLLIVRRSEKARYALNYDNSPAVLVDDFTINTSEWSRRGGHPILHISARSSINDLKRPYIRKLYSRES